MYYHHYAIISFSVFQFISSFGEAFEKYGIALVLCDRLHAYTIQVDSCGFPLVGLRFGYKDGPDLNLPRRVGT